MTDVIVMKHSNINDRSNFNPIVTGKAKMTESDTERKARTGLSSLKITDDQSKEVQKTPLRIGLDYMTGRIAATDYIHPTGAPHMTICVVYLDNGYILVGKSVPADPENYNLELGHKFAYEDAVRQAWPLFAFALREGMTSNSVLADLEDKADGGDVRP